MRGFPGMLWKRLALLCASVVSCFLVTELAIRIISPDRPLVHAMASFHQGEPSVGWTGLPHLASRFNMVDFDIRFRHDEKGFRVPGRSVVLNPGASVVAFLGDSFTWGYGVTTGRQFTDIVQTRLGPRFDVRNFGVNGFSTVQEWMLLRREMSNGLHPKAVVVMLFKNDFTDNVDANPTRPRLVVEGSNAPPLLMPVSEFIGTQSEPWEFFLKNLVLFRSERMKHWSYLYATIAHRIDLARMKRDARRLNEISYTSGRLADGPRRAMHWILEQLRNTCRAAGSTLACVYVASYEDVVADEDGAARTVSRDLCADLGIPFLDLTPILRKQGGAVPGKLFFAHDIHWSDEGNAIVGEEVSVFLGPLLSPPSGDP